jgi:hypothetical protein
MSLGNRRLAKSWVSGLADDMLHGRFRLTGQPIIFNERGVLVDGHHRLTALAQSGVTCEMLVVRGTSVEAFEAIDRGRRRSSADVTGADPRVMAVATLAVNCAVGATNRVSYSGRAVLEMCAPVLPLIEKLVALVTSHRRVWTSAPAILGIALAIVEEPSREDDILAQFRCVVDLDYASFAPSVAALHRAIESGALKASNGGESQKLTERTARAMSDLRKDVKRLMLARTGPTLPARVRSMLGIIELPKRRKEAPDA